MKIRTLPLVFSCLLSTLLAGQVDPSRINPELLERHWQARWIAPQGVSLTDFGVYHFRKNFSLESIPAEFIVHVSADNRYRLFVNGRSVAVGPARGDLAHWRFESVDLASELQPGRNVLSAVVWNFGEHSPWAQMSSQTGFLLQGNGKTEDVVNTNDSWRVFHNLSYVPVPPEGLNTFIVVGPGEEVDGSSYPWGWESPDFDDSKWGVPRMLFPGSPRGVGTDLERQLVPRQIPFLEERLERLSHLEKGRNLGSWETEFLKGTHPVTVPPQTTATLLFDQDHLTTAYPELTVSGGKGSRIALTYAEALFDENGSKGHRDDTLRRKILGIQDVFRPDGGQKRIFRPLWFRTYRYLQLDITTADEPLVLEDLRGMFTAYPFSENATFRSNDSNLGEIWSTGWRTARLCAGETYFDCPYYEQLQYVGDTRIQALISLHVSGDDRLMRKAIQIFDDSRLPGGLTQSRYPSRISQVIPPYSLFWVSMVYDYWMFRSDEGFVASFLDGIEGVLGWYENRMDDTGMLGKTPWWNFVDWPDEWPWSNEARIGGVPPGGQSGHSSILTLQFAYTLDQAAELFSAFGRSSRAVRYRALSESLKTSTYRLCWDEQRKLLADTPGKRSFSQHANILAVLTDVLPENQREDLMQRVLSEGDLVQSTFYFRFYLTRALVKAGLGDLYISQLEPWKKMLSLGLTTFAERPEPTRSDCHAWSASPLYDLLATVCGIQPMEPAFRSVLIEPHLGPLQWVEASVPHPAGTIEVKLKRVGEGGMDAVVILPEDTPGTFRWNGRAIGLRGGRQQLLLPDDEY